MELLTIIGLVCLIIIGFKLLGWILKAGFFLISIPFQILGAVIVILVMVALIPLGVISGLLAVILVPLGFLIPLLPFFMIGFGIYLLARK